MASTRIPLNRKVATSIIRRQEWTAVKFHDTEVVKFNDDVIKLDSGEWMTVTTKRRMNEVSAIFLLHYQVYQERGAWWVQFPNEEPIPFYDGITLSRDRSNPHPGEHKEEGERQYNGWPNRATWNCFLWLNNEEPYYRAYVAAARREAFTSMSAKRFVLRLWGYSSIFNARTPDGDPLGRVHWDRIAEAMNESRQA